MRQAAYLTTLYKTCKSLKGPRAKTAPLITLTSTLQTRFYDFRESAEIDITDVTMVGSE